MLYPVYVHPGDESHAHGVTFPDFPGCFSAADEWCQATPKTDPLTTPKIDPQICLVIGLERPKRA